MSEDNKKIRDLKRADLITLVEQLTDKVKSVGGDEKIKSLCDIIANYDNIISKQEQIIGYYGKIFDKSDDNVSLKDALESYRDKIEKYHNKIFISDEKNEVQSIEEKINNFHTQSSTFFNEISNFYKKLTEGDNSVSQQIESQKDSIQNAYNEVVGYKDKDGQDVLGLLKNVRQMQLAVTKYYDSLLKDDDKDDSIKTKIEEFYNQIKNLHTELLVDSADDKKDSISSKISNLKSECIALKEKIEDLLPGATSAGLASSYFDAKTKYHFLPKIGKSKEKWNIILWKSFANLLNNAFLYTLFILPIAFIVYNSFDVFSSFEEISKNNSVNGYAVTLLFLRFFVALPLGFISWFGFSSIKLRHRLFEEYNYKQRVMELYEGFDREITKNGTEEQRKNLIDIMLRAVSENPASLILHNVSLGSYIFGKDDNDKNIRIKESVKKDLQESQSKIVKNKNTKDEDSE